MGNMDLWDKVKQPPAEALKEIAGGRLKGYTDISPQWRYQILTEQFGPCGTGWVYVIKRTWCEPYGDEVLAFAEILLYIGDSKPIPGIGGSKLSTKETKGVYVCDEAYKMAVTDALSVACKVLGIGADIYAGKGSKYPTSPAQGTKQGAEQTPGPAPAPNASGDSKLISDGNAMIQAMTKSDPEKMKDLIRKHSGFAGDEGRVEKDSLEDLKGKWLFRTFKGVETEYQEFVSGKNEMKIADDNPPLPDGPDQVEAPF